MRSTAKRVDEVRIREFAEPRQEGEHGFALRRLLFGPRAAAGGGSALSHEPQPDSFASRIERELDDVERELQAIRRDHGLVA